MLSRITRCLLAFLQEDDGPTAVEYAIMLSLIIVVCLTAAQQVGQNASATFTATAAQINTGS